MPKPALAVLAVILGVIAGCILSAFIYAIVVGISFEIGGGSETESSSLWQRAWAFALTFGLVTGARWGLSGGYRVAGAEPGSTLNIVRILALLPLAVAAYMIFAGDRLDMLFGDVGFATVVLVVLWLAMTWWVAWTVEPRKKA